MSALNTAKARLTCGASASVKAVTAARKFKFMSGSWVCLSLAEVMILEAAYAELSQLGH
jgi:hypothetical protein